MWVFIYTQYTLTDKFKEKREGEREGERCIVKRTPTREDKISAWPQAFVGPTEKRCCAKNDRPTDQQAVGTQLNTSANTPLCTTCTCTICIYTCMYIACSVIDGRRPTKVKEDIRLSPHSSHYFPPVGEWRDFCCHW